MDQVNFFRNSLKSVAALAIGAALLVSHVTHASASNSATLGNDESSFVFAGKCFNGESYRLFSHQKIVAGKPVSFYAYDGPAGKGSVQTETTPKVMAQRVCRKFAEIISASYWEDPVAYSQALMRK